MSEWEVGGLISFSRYGWLLSDPFFLEMLPVQGDTGLISVEHDLFPELDDLPVFDPRVVVGLASAPVDRRHFLNHVGNSLSACEHPQTDGW